jgi:outer membrane lipoprotein-sorting protein
MSLERRTILLGLGAVATTLLVGRSSRADAVDDALAKVTKARASIKTLQAPFTQTRAIGLLDSEVKSKGLFTLVRPNRLRWDLKPPDAVTYWVGPEGLAMQSADGVTKVGKAAAGRFAAVLGDLLVMLGGDLATLRSRYDLEVGKDNGRFALTAKPTAKEVKKHVRKLRMVAGSELWVVERIEIHEANGDHSLIAFDKTTRDKKIPDSFMKPPKK